MTKPAPRPPKAEGIGEIARRVLPRAASEHPGVVLKLAEAQSRGVKLHESVGQMPAHSLLIELQIGAAGFGIAAVALDLRRALIECLTTGQVSSLRAEARPATELDFKLVAHVLDHWFAALGEVVPELAEGLRCKSRIPNARAVELGMENAIVERHDLSIDLDEGVVRDDLVLLLPDGALRRDNNLGDSLRRALMPVSADLVVVLTREISTLGRVAGLQPGDVLPVRSADLGCVSVEAPLGRAHALARLGRVGAARAIRLSAAEAISENGNPGTKRMTFDPPELPGTPRLSGGVVASDPFPPAMMGEEQVKPGGPGTLPDLPPLAPPQV